MVQEYWPNVGGESVEDCNGAKIIIRVMTNALYVICPFLQHSELMNDIMIIINSASELKAKLIFFPKRVTWNSERTRTRSKTSSSKQPSKTDHLLVALRIHLDSIFLTC